MSGPDPERSTIVDDGRNAAELPAAEAAEYEAPRVESVVTSEEVEREALYGGLVSMG